MTPEDVEFEFEPFLEENEENLPEGLDTQYMAYVPYLEEPFKHITKLPTALRNLPMNAVLHQDWKTMYTLFGLLMIISLPTFVSIIMAAAWLDITGLGVTIVIFIALGIFASFLYLKYIYGSLNTLVESRKAPWLVQKIRKPYNVAYQTKWDRRLLEISFILPLMLEIPLMWFVAKEAENITLVGYIILVLFILVGHLGASIMVFLSILNVRYIRINTSIYDQVLQTIIDRVKGYTDGYESILNKKNYEVVGVLSDTPGLSIRNLGDIPIYGLGSGIFIVNALLFLLLSPFMMAGPLAENVLQQINPTDDPFGVTYIILAGIAISSIVSFGAVIRPLIRITRVMLKFKNKALTELDPFIFDEITGVALRKDTEISNETQVLFMIRNYIYTMKVSPVNPFRLLQIIVLAILYSSRILPNVIALLT